MSIFKKKAKITVTPKDPVFYVRLIGSTETFKASGRGCLRLPIQKLWDSSESEQNMRRVAVTLSSSGIRLKDMESKKAKEQHFDIKRISYCNTDTELTRVFGWIYRSPESNKKECYGLVCSSPEKAQAMALVLSRAFQIAYSEFKREQARLHRHPSRQDQTEADNSATQTSQARQNGTAAAGEHSSSKANDTNPGNTTPCDTDSIHLGSDLTQMNISQDDNASQCSSENNVRIMVEEIEQTAAHNATVHELAKGDDGAVDELDHRQK